jgi:rhamnosyl/mannosyltransferase
MATLALWWVNPGCKIIVSWHSDIIRQKVLLLFFRPFQNWLLKKADSLVATTPNYIKDSRALQKYPSKTTFIPIGVKRLEVSNSGELNRLQREYESRKIVFSLGRLVGYKGFEFLVDAARYLDDRYVILIGGEGPLRKSIERQISDNNLGKKVVLLGRLSAEELPLYFQLCGAYCMSSITKNEAFGLVLVEAMSLSKPVIATKIPGSGVPWVNEDSVSGLNVEIENSKELARAIREILENEETQRKYGAGAEDRFSRLFEKELMVDGYLELYRNLLTAKITKEE